VALAQFEGTLVLVSHDRHLLRATTDQFLIVADGRLRSFDGDLDDYRDWLLKSKLEKPLEKPAEAAPKRKPPPSSSTRRSLEARIKRLEEMIDRLNAKKSALEARLADAALYRPEAKDALQAALLDQAYVGKELVELEGEWLEKQAQLD
jgi:ATP-binding cassette subfamily F protein 3